jgi:hypothetical protein
VTDEISLDLRNQERCNSYRCIQLSHACFV